MDEQNAANARSKYIKNHFVHTQHSMDGKNIDENGHCSGDSIDPNARCDHNKKENGGELTTDIDQCRHHHHHQQQQPRKYHRHHHRTISAPPVSWNIHDSGFYSHRDAYIRQREQREAATPEGTSSSSSISNNSDQIDEMDARRRGSEGVRKGIESLNLKSCNSEEDGASSATSSGSRGEAETDDNTSSSKGEQQKKQDQQQQQQQQQVNFESRSPVRDDARDNNVVDDEAVRSSDRLHRHRGDSSGAAQRGPAAYHRHRSYSHNMYRQFQIQQQQQQQQQQQYFYIYQQLMQSALYQQHYAALQQQQQHPPLPHHHHPHHHAPQFHPHLHHPHPHSPHSYLQRGTYSNRSSANSSPKQHRGSNEQRSTRRAITFTNNLRGKKETIINEYLNVDTNLYRFFKHTTPFVSCMSEDAVDLTDQRMSLNLKDVWNFYDEPYGIEVPVVLSYHNEEKPFTYVVDEFVYFVPHLSAIQLFLRDREHEPTFEFFETSKPHMRYPLIDKIEELARERCPELLTLRSADLSNKSWFSIAWYPILCHNTTINWLKGQMITYHSLQPQETLIDERYCPFLESELTPIEEQLQALRSIADGTNDDNDDDSERSISSPSRNDDRLSKIHILESRIKSILDNETLMSERIRDDLRQDKEENEENHNRFFAPIIGFVPYRVKSDMWFRINSSSPAITGSKRSRSGSLRSYAGSTESSPYVSPSQRSRQSNVKRSNSMTSGKEANDTSSSNGNYTPRVSQVQQSDQFSTPSRSNAKDSPHTSLSVSPSALKTPPPITYSESGQSVSPTSPTAPSFVPSFRKQHNQENAAYTRMRSYSDSSSLGLHNTAIISSESENEFRAPLHLVRACTNFLQQRQIEHPDFEHCRERWDALR